MLLSTQGSPLLKPRTCFQVWIVVLHTYCRFLKPPGDNLTERHYLRVGWSRRSMTSSFNRYTASGSCLILIHCIFCGYIAWLLFKYFFLSQPLFLSIKVLHSTLYTHVHTNLGTSSLNLKNAYHIYRAYPRSSDHRHLLTYPISQLDRRSEGQRTSGSPGRPNIWKSLPTRKLPPCRCPEASQEVWTSLLSPNGQQGEHRYLLLGRQNANHRTSNSASFSWILSNPPKTFGSASRPPWCLANPTHIPQDHL